MFTEINLAFFLKVLNFYRLFVFTNGLGTFTKVDYHLRNRLRSMVPSIKIRSQEGTRVQFALLSIFHEQYRGLYTIRELFTIDDIIIIVIIK